MVALSRRVDFLLGATLSLYTCLIWCCQSVRTELKECLRNASIECGQCDGDAAGRSQYPNCDSCIDDRLEPSSDCAQCRHGEPNCHMGNFMLSVYFHSYLNEKHLCGECQENKVVCCDTDSQTVGCTDSNICEVRLVVSVESYKALPRDVSLPRHPPDINSDNVSMFMEGEDVFNESNISNPYQVQMNTWTGRIQFYAVVYDAYRVEKVPRGRFAVDRFTVNIDFGREIPASKTTETYYGIYNISEFVLSFSIRCSEGFTGPSCNISTSCVDYPCSTIRVPVSDLKTTSLSLIAGGVIGGIIAIIILSLLCVIPAILLCKKRRRKWKVGQYEIPDASTGMEYYMMQGPGLENNGAAHLPSVVQDQSNVAHSPLQEQEIQMKKCEAYGRVNAPGLDQDYEAIYY